MTKGARTLYEARRAKNGVDETLITSAPPALRLPMGIAVVVGGIIIAIAIGIYFLGYRSGFSAAENVGIEARQGLAQTRDPLLLAPATASGSNGSKRTAGDRTPEIQQSTNLTASAGANQGLSPLGPPPISDPRVVGLYYYIIVDGISADRAAEMIAFCRGLGLDAVTISSHNARSQVIVLPGFGWDDRAGGPVKALEASIRAVGAKWKALGRGNGDFRDFYPKLFKGSS